MKKKSKKNLFKKFFQSLDKVKSIHYLRVRLSWLPKQHLKCFSIYAFTCPWLGLFLSQTTMDARAKINFHLLALGERTRHICHRVKHPFDAKARLFFPILDFGKRTWHCLFEWDNHRCKDKPDFPFSPNSTSPNRESNSRHHCIPLNLKQMKTKHVNFCPRACTCQNQNPGEKQNKICFPFTCPQWRDLTLSIFE